MFNKKKATQQNNAVVSSKQKDYSNDPFVVKKIESSKKAFKKYGYPKELING